MTEPKQSATREALRSGIAGIALDMETVANSERPVTNRIVSWWAKELRKLYEKSAESEKATHTDHPARHWDRTCPACVGEKSDKNPDNLTGSSLPSAELCGTPRTDAILKESPMVSDIDDMAVAYNKLVDHSRQLERELEVTFRERNDCLQAQINSMRSATVRSASTTTRKP